MLDLDNHANISSLILAWASYFDVVLNSAIIILNISHASRDGVTQTKREESTSVPKPSRYMAGLRGCNSTKTTITMVDLTLDVDQT